LERRRIAMAVVGIEPVSAMPAWGSAVALRRSQSSQPNNSMSLLPIVGAILWAAGSGWNAGPKRVGWLSLFHDLCLSL
jgi:hypothetical protein